MKKKMPKVSYKKFVRFASFYGISPTEEKLEKFETFLKVYLPADGKGSEFFGEINSCMLEWDFTK